MGGYGALSLAILNPGLFGVAGADSPSLHDQATAPAFFGDAAYFAAHDPAALHTAHPEIARTLALWLDVGQQDPWLPPIQALHAALDAAGIPHAWTVFPGDHTGAYWSAHVPDYLRFYGMALTGTPATAIPATTIPATAAPPTDVPATTAPATAPATDAPATAVPPTAPATDAPTTAVPRAPATALADSSSGPPLPYLMPRH